ncbi:YidB family protein [Otariodibacter sp.]|uniref:YidB family protein n=1 Tax=Otariodibacter sp. TaxID=3030919 RepID=UPI00263585D2|nr:YidB family protein [Otariodibacter sp.]
MLGNILGSVASSVLGGGEGQSKAIQLIQTLLQSQGGIQGLIAKFQQGGLEELVKSWIGTEENKPISTTQIVDVFGKDNLDNAAQEAGIEQHEAPNLLSEYLPKIVDALSPDGKLDLDSLNTSDLLQQGAKAVFGKLFN